MKRPIEAPKNSPPSKRGSRESVTTPLSRFDRRPQSSLLRAHTSPRFFQSSPLPTGSLAKLSTMLRRFLVLACLALLVGESKKKRRFFLEGQSLLRVVNIALPHCHQLRPPLRALFSLLSPRGRLGSIILSTSRREGKKKRDSPGKEETAIRFFFASWLAG